MKLINQSKRGLQIASSSFSFLWHHPQLLLYAIVPILIQVTFELILYNMLVGSQNKIPLTFAEFDSLALFIARIPNWLHYGGLLAIIFVSFFIMLFFNAALINHTMHILQYKKSSIAQSIQAAMQKFFILFCWALISLIPLVMLQATQSSVTSSTPWLPSLFIIVASITFSGAWSLITLFVMPVITLEPRHIGSALVKSFSILKHYFIQTISGELFLGFLTIFAFSMTLFLGSAYSLLAASYTSMALAGVTFLSILIRCILTTAHTIFKTIIYDEYTSPEREFTFSHFLRF